MPSGIYPIKKRRGMFKKGIQNNPNGGFQKGKASWNKGKKTGLIPKTAWKKEEHPSIKTEFKINQHASSKTEFQKGHKTMWTEEMREKARTRMKGNRYRWRGGLSYEPYSIDWTDTLKKSIRERDHYICQLRFKDGYAVHHINYNKKNCNPDNLITLCFSCNVKVNANRNYWTNYFKSI